MKVEILDLETFDALDPRDIERYLAHNNWREFKRTPGEATVWDIIDKSEKRFRVWIPADRNLGDFAASIGRAVKIIALAEERSQLQILDDLETIGVGDVIRMASEDPFNRSGNTLPLREGLSFVRQAQDLMTAAACSALEKRAVHPYRRPNRVLEYVKNARLGQTERGSYLIKVISPVSAPTAVQMPLPGISGADEIPFERQVVISLWQGLDALRRVSDDTFRRGRFYFEAYQEIVSEGVSADLCDAVASAQENEQYRPIEIGITWSYNLKSPGSNYHDIRFEHRVLPYIAQAAQQFREKNPLEITLKGFVTALRRRKIGDPSAVTIVGLVEDTPRSVRVTLSDEAYTTAIHAHESDSEISVDGRLIRQGNFFILENPSNLHISGPGPQE